MIYADENGHFFKEIGESFKYVGKRTLAAVQASAETVYDVGKSTVELAWNFGTTLGNEIKYVGNEISYGIGNTNETEYLNTKADTLSVISQNMDIYKKIPGQMVTGVVDNFKKTFNKNNFLNYWNPNTSYTELKDYSKSVIQTGATLYGEANILKSIKAGLPKIEYTPGPAMQYAGTGINVATFGTLTVTAGKISDASILGNVSLIAGSNYEGSNQENNNVKDKANYNSNREVSDNDFENWLNKEKNDNKVYFGIDGEGKKVYTGITKQLLEKRLYQHNYKGKNFAELRKQYSNLTRNQARSLEQYLIENEPNEKNSINSISPNFKYYKDAIKWAEKIIINNK